MDYLPDLIEFNGNFDEFIESVYGIFNEEILTSGITFRNLPVRPRYSPEYKNKELGFWHITSEGSDNREEEDRLPDLDRCRRIRWISWMIINHNHDDVHCWEERRKSTTEIVIWHESARYVVVLSERSNYWLLKTAYPITYSSKERSLRSSLRRANQ
ncbi:oxidoreductase [Providencia rettgeri]|uniref:oxidoreductase n=1 Tax=Providencia rettgeri TaxID=587 RepID=UPI001B3865F4|nr:oxidoreductase [Providencia rettgeri]EJD6367381.1 oxidoreductase [Providencia rettgeri]EJD6371610.1 oxidoreductase [Providencia rettgeri]ELR5161058.1 oxidoreductase [Providencia rettgeri]ELR5250179.1 oxidoreductase [Providencia rettgeri]MBQ0360961.1 oxidoreductase [Providencia rettgeri]